jgi:CubicO group peptidase (beta-lactamase class C family)
VLWWTNKSGEMPGVPRDAYWAWGLGDNLIVVIPSLDVVIARTGNNPDDPSLPQLRTERNGDYGVLVPLLTPIVESVTDD